MHLTVALSLFTLALVAQDPKAPEAKPQTPPPAQVETKAPVAKPHDHAQDAKPAAAAKPDPKKVVAVIGGEVLRQEDLDAAVEAMPAQQRMQLEYSPGAKARYQQAYVDSRVLAAKARKDGIQSTDGFRKKMRQAEEQILASELVMRDSKDLMAKATPSEEQMKAYFEKNKATYAKPETFTARHILVAVGNAVGEGKGLPEDKAKERVAEIQKRLAAGEKFEDLVAAFSDDEGSKKEGGKYVDFDASRMVPEFAQAVRTQELNKVGEPVKTQFGFHIIEVLGKKPPFTPEFAAVKEEVRQKMGPERQEQVWNEYVTGLKQELKVVTGEEAEKAAAAIKPAAPQGKKTGKRGAK